MTTHLAALFFAVLLTAAVDEAFGISLAAEVRVHCPVAILIMVIPLARLVVWFQVPCMLNEILLLMVESHNQIKGAYRCDTNTISCCFHSSQTQSRTGRKSSAPGIGTVHVVWQKSSNVDSC